MSAATRCSEMSLSQENQLLLDGEVFHYTGKAGATLRILQAERFVRCDRVGLL